MRKDTPDPPLSSFLQADTAEVEHIPTSIVIRSDIYSLGYYSPLVAKRRLISAFQKAMAGVTFCRILMFALLLGRTGVAGFGRMCRIEKSFARNDGLVCRVSDYGKDMDQEAMMESDMLVVVDENDVLVDGAIVSKRKAHEFNEKQPRGIAHRAFSMFIFNDKKEMLLTRRADSKITFPGVWTNTCCSHPLYGMEPTEVDEVPASFPSFPGIKHAAIRKLRHELGIDPKYVPHDEIQFVSRFHYWAADTRTYGSQTPWGEHEIDYVLFLQNKSEQPEIHPNPEEVSEWKYVSIDELKKMFEEPGLEWSPWFRGIMNLSGFEWWNDLEATLEGKHCHSEVTFFDPPQDHFASFNLPSHDRSTGVLSNQVAGKSKQ